MGAVGNTNPSTTGAGSAGNSVSQSIQGAQQTLTSNESTFLTLLTTQLQHQDPLSPMDTNAFTQQLVSMTGVQQQILTNQLLQQLVGSQTAAGNPVQLIGKTVSATSDTANLQGGKAGWQYSTGSNATDVVATVTNSLGQVVSTTDLGGQAAGDHTFSWNGKDSSGVQMPDGGTYTLSVTATDSSGGKVSTSVFQTGVVSGVNVVNNQPELQINGASVPASDVTSVTSQ